MSELSTAEQEQVDFLISIGAVRNDERGDLVWTDLVGRNFAQVLDALEAMPDGALDALLRRAKGAPLMSPVQARTREGRLTLAIALVQNGLVDVIEGKNKGLSVLIAVVTGLDSVDAAPTVLATAETMEDVYSESATDAITRGRLARFLLEHHGARASAAILSGLENDQRLGLAAEQAFRKKHVHELKRPLDTVRGATRRFDQTKLGKALNSVKKGFYYQWQKYYERELQKNLNKAGKSLGWRRLQWFWLPLDEGVLGLSQVFLAAYMNLQGDHQRWLQTQKVLSTYDAKALSRLTINEIEYLAGLSQDRQLNDKEKELNLLKVNVRSRFVAEPKNFFSLMSRQVQKFFMNIREQLLYALVQDSNMPMLDHQIFENIVSNLGAHPTDAQVREAREVLKQYEKIQRLNAVTVSPIDYSNEGYQNRIRIAKLQRKPFPYESPIVASVVGWLQSRQSRFAPKSAGYQLYAGLITRVNGWAWGQVKAKISAWIHRLPTELAQAQTMREGLYLELARIVGDFPGALLPA